VAVFGWPGVADWKARARRRYMRRHGDASRPNGANEKRPEDETEQLRRRVENLEAIVTSADWDLPADLDDADDPETRAAALADETIPG
jgi:hypothetical protein